MIVELLNGESPKYCTKMAGVQKWKICQAIFAGFISMEGPHYLLRFAVML